MSKSSGRRILRLYAQSKGKEAIEFVTLEKDEYGGESDILKTKDSNGEIEKTGVRYKELFHWMVKSNHIDC